MIIINFKGGLGNQLFQYAAGCALLLRQQEKNTSVNKDNYAENKDLSSILKLDITGYGENNGIDTMRHYSLSPFNIKAEIATRKEIRKLKYPYGIISKGWRFFKAKVLRQFNTNFHQRIFDARGPLYLDGFFQTEKYFKDKEKEIRADLTLKNPLGQEAQKASARIQNAGNSVSLHVRRGDYVSDPKTNQRHGLCGPNYYSQALERMTSKIGKDITVFVFSDGIDWVKENMPIPFPAVYVSSSEIADYEELIIMSQCHHHIIANSSFSWWGAWLNPRPDKVIIAPSQWVRTTRFDLKDIVPSGWIRI
jgi:hypothetical protein